MPTPVGKAQRASQGAVGIIRRPLYGVRCSSLLWCPPIVARDQPQAGGRHAHGLLEGETMSGSGESDDDRPPDKGRGIMPTAPGLSLWRWPAESA